MAEEADKESKTEDPTSTRLDEARKKGDVAKSMDLPQWASLAAAFSVMAVAGGWMVRDLAGAMVPFIASPEAFEVTGEGLRQVMGTAMLAVGVPIGAVMLSAALAGAAGSLVQTGLLFSPEKIKPDFKKLSPMQGWKRLFGADALFQFGKSFVKLIAIAVVVWIIFKPHARELETLVALPPSALLPLARELLISMFGAVLILLLAGAGFDWFWQRLRWMKRMRMSKEEVKQDYKNSEGDPHVKAKLKQIRMEKSRKRMMQAVPTATVVVMNPTHYAVALKYEPGETAAPICVAKGVDALALRIRDLAREHGVEVVEDPPLARALYAAVDVDETIPRQHFEAVATIIGFILGKRKPR
ncbi:MAG: flagellar biosynthesis protein FlhB [Proteobacteria bacterium]|nr:flagellar biosynthesis protein FlhB [Pseudomonadota bacterium]